MNRKSFVKLIAAVVIAAGIIALLVWGYRGSRREMAMEQERERPVKAPSRVSVQEGEVVVTLDQATMLKSGIAVAPLAPISHRAEARAPGVVLMVQTLLDARAAYAGAMAQVQKPEAALAASRKAYERVKALNADGQLASDRAVQSSEAAWRSDLAATEAGRTSLHALKGSIRQQWGSVIAGWVTGGSPEFERLADQRDLLVRVTLPAAERIAAAPQSVRIEATDGTITPARLVSPSPTTDPRIQGASFFYLAPARSRLLPGMNVIVRLPVGSTRNGVVIPASAVVWWQGKAWIYLQKGKEQFVRRETSMDNPVEGGWFTAQGVSPTDRVVARGAQLLQSEEFRSQIQVGEEEGKK